MLDSLIHSALSQNLIVILLGMLPIAELRAALPVGISVFHMPWYQAFYLSVIGNLIPVPFLLLFFGAVSKLIQKTAKGKQFIEWLLTRTAKRTANLGKYKFAGLMIFVAIPAAPDGRLDSLTGSLYPGDAFLAGLTCNNAGGSAGRSDRDYFNLVGLDRGRHRDSRHSDHRSSGSLEIINYLFL